MPRYITRMIPLILMPRHMAGMARRTADVLGGIPAGLARPFLVLAADAALLAVEAAGQSTHALPHVLVVGCMTNKGVKGAGNGEDQR